MSDVKTDKVTIIMYILTGVLLACLIGISLLCNGCSSFKKQLTESASGKNIGMSGYMMLGELSTDTNGRLIVGRLDYKSRKVSIPADTKTPNTGFFKATKTRSLFGTTEYIIEYDWTAGSDADAEAAQKRCEELKKKAEEEIGVNDDKQTETSSANETIEVAK